jgi:hypothetical protein
MPPVVQPITLSLYRLSYPASSRHLDLHIDHHHHFILFHTHKIRTKKLKYYFINNNIQTDINCPYVSLSPSTKSNKRNCAEGKFDAFCSSVQTMPAPQGEAWWAAGAVTESAKEEKKFKLPIRGVNRGQRDIKPCWLIVLVIRTVSSSPINKDHTPHIWPLSACSRYTEPG